MNNSSKRRTNLVPMAECAILTALSVVLSLFKIPQPFGGSITLLSMLPIMIFSYRRGVKWGLVSGFLFSAVKLVLGLENFAWIPAWYGVVMSVFFDYLLAYSAIGLAGAFRKMKLLKNNAGNLMINCILGIALACVVRFFFHLLSGAFIWASIEGEGDWNTAAAWIYSLTYNGSYMLPESIITACAAPIMAYVIKISPVKLHK